MGPDTQSVTFESADPSEKWTRLNAIDMSFPKEPTEKHPLRHTINIGTFTREELYEIYQALEAYLY
jgi:hypothetical protein